MTRPQIVSRAEWLEARKAHLKREKDHMRAWDRLCEERRALPWVKVDKEYEFDTPTGKKSLGDLFDGRSQMIVYHFMFGPGWKEGCDGCSFLADHFDGANLHLRHHDVTLMVVSRAPLAEFLPFKKRMNWHFPWVSSHGSDFNYDFDASFRPDDVEAGKTTYNFAPYSGKMEDLHGISVFYRDPDTNEIFHTYSSYSRGGDPLIGAHAFLDLTPFGRNENGTMDWVKLHDLYEESSNSKSCCH